MKIFERDGFAKGLRFARRDLRGHAVTDDEWPQAHKAINCRVHRLEVAVQDLANHSTIAYFGAASVVGTEDLPEPLAREGRIASEQRLSGG